MRLCRFGLFAKNMNPMVPIPMWKVIARGAPPAHTIVSEATMYYVKKLGQCYGEWSGDPPVCLGL